MLTVTCPSALRSTSSRSATTAPFPAAAGTSRPGPRPLVIIHPAHHQRHTKRAKAGAIQAFTQNAHRSAMRRSGRTRSAVDGPVHGALDLPHELAWSGRPRARDSNSRGVPPTRFRVLRSVIHLRPRVYLTSMSRRFGFSGERLRTGVNE